MSDTGHQREMEVQYLEQHADPAIDAPDLTAGPLRVVAGNSGYAYDAAYYEARAAWWRKQRAEAQP